MKSLIGIMLEIENDLDEYYTKMLCPTKAQAQYNGRQVIYRLNGKSNFGTIVGGYLNNEKTEYIFSAFHVLGERGQEVTVPSKDVKFLK